MKNIITAARRAGVHNIECPNCKRKFNTSQLLRLVFKAILEMVYDGETVSVPKFGMFRAITMKARSHKTPIMESAGGVARWPKRKVMKFKQSANARRVMNPENSAAAKKAAKKTAKARAARLRRELSAIQEQKERVSAANKRKYAKKKAAMLLKKRKK